MQHHQRGTVGMHEEASIFHDRADKFSTTVPTTARAEWREPMSSTEARCSLPSPVGISVPSPYHLQLIFYRELRAFPAMSACIRVSAYLGAMRRVTDSALLRKPH